MWQSTHGIFEFSNARWSVVMDLLKFHSSFSKNWTMFNPLRWQRVSRTITSDRAVYNNSSLSFSFQFVCTTSLDRNYEKVINSSSISSGLHLNILTTEEMLQKIKIAINATVNLLFFLLAFFNRSSMEHWSESEVWDERECVCREFKGGKKKQKKRKRRKRRSMARQFFSGGT